MPPDMQRALSIANARGEPISNIKAGVGYLLMRFARYGFKSVTDRDSRLYETSVRQGDSLDRIARENGTTRETLERLNPALHVLRPGQVLQFRKAAIRKVSLAGIHWRRDECKWQRTQLYVCVVQENAKVPVLRPSSFSRQYGKFGYRLARYRLCVARRLHRRQKPRISCPQGEHVVLFARDAIACSDSV
jgi:hypothetical protein